MVNNKKTSLGTSMVMAVLAIVVLGISIKQQLDLKNNQNTQIQEIKKQVNELKGLSNPSNFSDYESLSSLKKVIIASNFSSWSPSSTLDDGMIKRAVILDKGQLSKGYIYVRASIEGKPLTQWESTYLTMNYVGGHLFRPQSLPLPSSSKTELLYALNSVPYLSDIPYNEQKTPSVANWFVYFNDGNVINLTSFISSLKPALLEELTIYYQCVDNNDCLLTVK